MKSLKNLKNTLALAGSMLIASYSFGQDVQKHDEFDRYMSAKDIYRIEMNRMKKKKLSRDDSLKINQDIMIPLFQYGAQPGSNGIVGVGINDNDDGTISFELLYDGKLEGTVSIDDVLSNPDIPWSFKKAVANDYNVEEKLSKLEKQTKNWYKNLRFGASANFRPVEQEDGLYSEAGYQINLGIPLFLNGLNFNMSADINNSYRTETNDETILDTYDSPCGRTFLDVESIRNITVVDKLGDIGPEYTIFRDGKYPLSFGAGTNLISTNETNIRERETRVFFDGQEIGEANTLEESVVLADNSKLSLNGWYAQITAALGTKGLYAGAKVSSYEGAENTYTVSLIAEPFRLFQKK